MSLKQALKHSQAARNMRLGLWVAWGRFANGVKYYAISTLEGWSHYPTLADVEKVLGESAVKEGWE